MISDNLLDTDKNPKIICLLCGGLAKGIFHALPASSSRADAVHLTSIYECNRCGHIQKHVDDEYKETLEAIYQSSYMLPAQGRKIDFVDGETLSREKSLSQALSTVLVGHRDSAVTSILDFGTGSGHLVPPLKQVFPHAYVAAYDVSDDKELIVRSNGAEEFFSGDLGSIKGSFDLITLNHVLEHLPDPVSTLKKLAVLLTLDGFIAVVVPCYKKVWTEFFFVEHCSHFTPHSLNVVAALAGLDVVDRLSEKLGSVEIGFVARRTELADGVSPNQAVSWSQSLLKLIDEQQPSDSLGVFGVSGAGMWLAAVRKSQISFIVDDDPLKRESTLAGIPILSVTDIPKSATVIVTYNNPLAAKKMHQRLMRLRPDVRFLAPPLVV